MGYDMFNRVELYNNSMFHVVDINTWVIAIYLHAVYIDYVALLLHYHDHILYLTEALILPYQYVCLYS